MKSKFCRSTSTFNPRPKRIDARFLCLLLLALLAAACGRGDYEDTPETFSETWWVATTGDDSNTCDSPSSPCLTIRAALQKSDARDAELLDEHPDLLAINTTIRIAAGVYNEPGYAGAMLRITKPLSLVGAGSGATILDGRGVIAGVLVRGGSAGDTITISGLTIRNTVLGSAYACLDLQSDAAVRLSDVTVRNCLRYGIWNRGNGRVEMNYSSVIHAIDENPDAFILNGIGILNDGEMTIVGSTIADNEDDGIVNNGRLFIRSTTIENNQTFGIKQYSTRELNLNEVTIANNALSGLGTALLLLDGETTVIGGLITGHPGTAVFLHGALNMTGTSMTMNDGGALATYPGAVAILDEVTINNNGAIERSAMIGNAGDLTITNSHINNNQGTPLANGGAGVATISDTEFRSNNMAAVNQPVIFNSDTAEMSITRSLIALNRTGSRAAIQNFGDATMTIVNVTVSGNRSAYAVQGSGNFDMSYTTIADNQAYGILTDAVSPVRIANILLARNTLGDCPSLLLTGSSGSYVISGFNIDTDGSCGASATYTPTTIRLGPLADNGGPTQTHELLVSPTISPAIDAASGACSADDQRGVGRPAGASCDVGAYEAGIASLPLESGAEIPTETPPVGIVTITTTTDTGCFQGPGEAWTRYNTLKAGLQAQVVGKGYGVDWLVVQHPEFSNINCWVNLKDVDFDFPLDQLRLISIPGKPTATPGPTNEPREETPKPTVCFYNQQQQYICQ